VQKYALATQAVVTLNADDGELHFAVEDDGKGFEPAKTHRGSGLTNMADRLDALGGGIELDSKPGSGTRLRGKLPLPALEVVA
jgi:signal transduction histidine kinase